MNTEQQTKQWRGSFHFKLLLGLLGLLVAGVVAVASFRSGSRPAGERLSQVHFLEHFHSGTVKDGIIWYNNQNPLLQDVTGHYVKPGTTETVKFMTTVHLDDALDRQLRDSGKFEVRRPTTLVQNLMVSFVPIVAVLVTGLLALVGLITVIRFLLRRPAHRY